jgi:hypothetical protein
MTKFPGDVVAVIKSLPTNVWNDVFDNLKQSKLVQLISTDDVELPKLKAQVQMIEELRQNFLTERAR